MNPAAISHFNSFQINRDYYHDELGYEAVSGTMNACCKTVGKLGSPEDSNKVAVSSCPSSPNARDHTIDVCSMPCDNETIECLSFENSGLDSSLLNDNVNVASCLKSSIELDTEYLDDSKFNKTLLEMTEETEWTEDLFFLSTDETQKNTSKKNIPDEITKAHINGAGLEVDGKIVTRTGEKLCCMECGYSTLNTQFFEDHMKKPHNCIQLEKDAPMSPVKLICSGCGENGVNSDMNLFEYEQKLPWNEDVLVRKHECSEGKNMVIKPNMDIISKIYASKPERLSSQAQSIIGPENKQKIFKAKKRVDIFYIKLNMFHCILCPFHTRYRRCILRHVRNVHVSLSGSRKRKCCNLSRSIRIPKPCRTEQIAKNDNSQSKALSIKQIDFTTIKHSTTTDEIANLPSTLEEQLSCPSRQHSLGSNNCIIKQHTSSTCEPSLIQQNNEQVMLVSCLSATDSDKKSNSRVSVKDVDTSLYSSPNKITNDNNIVKGSPTSSKRMALEIIVKKLKSRTTLIKCKPAVTFLNNQTTNPRHSIPYCRITEEEQAKGVTEAYNFLNQQKIESAAEYFNGNNNEHVFVPSSVPEVEVVLSGDEPDAIQMWPHTSGYNGSNNRSLKLTQDESKSLSLQSCVQKEPRNTYIALYQCDSCYFESANFMSLLSHYRKQHPEQNISSSRIRKYSSMLNVKAERVLPKPMNTMPTFDSDFPEVAASCSEGISELYFCKQPSTNGDSVSMFDHCQKQQTCRKVDKTLFRKTSEKQSRDVLQVKAALESSFLSCSEPQEVFEYQSQVRIRAGKMLSGEQVTKVQEKYSDIKMEPSTMVEGYRCDHCGRLFKALSGLRTHEKTHFGSKTWHSRNVSQSLNSQNCKNKLKNLTQQGNSEAKRYRCPRCSYSTSLIEQLRSHSLKVHGRFLMPKLRASGSDAKQSGECLYQAYDENVFLELQQDILDPYSQTPELGIGAQRSLPISVESYSCEFCDFITYRMQNMKNHYSKIHCEYPYFKCRKCSFFSGKKNALSQHAEFCKLGVGMQRFSTGKIDRDILVADCGVQGNEKEYTVLGVSSNEGESQTLRCPLCLYNTKHKNSLVNHIVEHKNKRMASLEKCEPNILQFPSGRVYCCDQCSFFTDSQDNLIGHLNFHTPLKPYKCRLCFFETALQTELETHLKQLHKVKCNLDLAGEVDLDEADLVADMALIMKQREKTYGEEKKRKLMRIQPE